MNLKKKIKIKILLKEYKKNKKLSKIKKIKKINFFFFY